MKMFLTILFIGIADFINNPVERYKQLKEKEQ